MTDDLSREDAERLFNSVSKAVKTNDLVELDSLYSNKPEEEEEVETPLEEENPEVKEPAEEQPEEAEEEETSPLPEDESEAGKPQKKKEPETPAEQTELDKLKEQLESMKKENHALRSQAGRVPHVQKRLRELDKKLEELTKTSPSSQTSTKIKPKLDGLLEGIKETDPKLADAIAAAISEATNGVDEEIRSREIENLKFIRQQESSSYQAQEAERLLEMYPNAPQVFQSPHWAEWKKKQSDGVVGLAESSNADDVSRAFKMYAEDMQALYPELGKKPAEEAPKVQDPAALEKAKKIEEERARKKTTAANVATPSAAGKKSIPDDPEALFKKISEQLAKERRGE